VGFYGTTPLRLELPIIGSFGLKFFPSGFENSLTPSNLRLSNVRSELFSDRNENHSVAHLQWRDDAHARAFMTKLF
jgi:hypothetical protein